MTQSGFKTIFAAVLLMATAWTAQAQCLCSSNSDNTLTITEYDGSSGAITLPTKVDGITITGIALHAFFYHANVTSITIPDTYTGIGDAVFTCCTSLTNVIVGSGVASIGYEAFGSCSNLTSVYFKGNAPKINSNVFTNETPTIYYLPGTKGWEATFAGCPTKLWKR